MALTKADQDCFALISRAAFCNPFTDEYREMIDQISEGAGPQGVGPAVTDRVEAIAKRGFGELGDFSGKERETMRLVFLYDAYHRVQRELDQLVLDQLQAGETALPVPCARENLRLMRQRGLEPEECTRYFSIFFRKR